MSDTPVVETITHTRNRCRHIHSQGSQCGSPALRNEIFCYFHHTTRRPKAGPGKMRYLDATEPFELPVIEDRASALSVASQIISRIATNDLDVERASRIMYMLQVLTKFLPAEARTRPATEATAHAPSVSAGDPIPASTPEFVSELVIDSIYGPIAPAPDALRSVDAPLSPVAETLPNMLGLQTHTHQPCREVLESRDAGDDPQSERRSDWTRVLENSAEHFVGERLQPLRSADGGLAVGLDVAQVPVGEGAAAQWFAEDVGGGDSILQGDVDADAAHGRHGMSGVPDTQQARNSPALKVIDLHREQFDLVPGFDGCGTSREERRDAFDALAEGRQPSLLHLREGSFGNDVGSLKVFDAIDEDEQAAIVDVTKSALGIGCIAREAQPEDIDRNAFFNDLEVSGTDRCGVAPVTSYSERGPDLGGSVGSVGEHACDARSVMDQVCPPPAHAEREVGIMGGLGGEEVEEVPLRRESNILAHGRQVRAVGDGKLAPADVDTDALDNAVTHGCEETIEQA